MTCYPPSSHSLANTRIPISVMGCHMSTINIDALNQLTSFCSECLELVLIAGPIFLDGKIYPLTMQGEINFHM